MGHTVGSARYVSLTTFKRDGNPVSCPVWIAPALSGSPFRSDELVFVSLADSFKVKRLRRNSRVAFRPERSEDDGAVLFRAPLTDLGSIGELGPVPGPIQFAREDSFKKEGALVAFPKTGGPGVGAR